MAITTASARRSTSRLPHVPLLPLATAALLIAVGFGLSLEFPDGNGAAALVGAAIAGFALWMLLSERYAVTLAVLMVYVGLADGYLKLKTGSDQITLVRDMLLYAIVVGALARAAMRGEKFDLPPLKAWVIAWVVVVAIQIFNPHAGTLYHSLASTRQHIEWIPLFFFGYFVIQSRARLRNFLFLLVLITAINGVISLIQFRQTPDQLAAWGPGYAKAINGEGDVSARIFTDDSGVDHTRPFALGGDFGFGGSLAILAVPALIALLSMSRRFGIRALTSVLGVGVVLAIATSNARVAVIGSIIALIAFAALTVTSRAGIRSVIAISVIAAIAYATFSVFSSDTSSGSLERYSTISNPGEAVSTTIDYRRGTLEQIPKYASKFPFGAGIGSNGPASALPGRPLHAALNAESEPTFLLIELGVPGLLVLLGFNLTLFYLSITHIRRVADREMRILLTAIAAPLFALFSVWVVGATTATTPGAPYLWLSGGILSYWLLGDGWRKVLDENRSIRPESALALAA